MYEIIYSIKKNNMIFVSAQPDIQYFHWQVEVYLYQFSKYNIQDNCFALFGYTGNELTSSIFCFLFFIKK